MQVWYLFLSKVVWLWPTPFKRGRDQGPSTRESRSELSGGGPNMTCFLVYKLWNKDLHSFGKSSICISFSGWNLSTYNPRCSPCVRYGLGGFTPAIWVGLHHVIRVVGYIYHQPWWHVSCVHQHNNNQYHISRRSTISLHVDWVQLHQHVLRISRFCSSWTAQFHGVKPPKLQRGKGSSRSCYPPSTSRRS